MPGAQRRAGIDQVTQHVELHRGATRAVPAIGKDLRWELLLHSAQRAYDALLPLTEGDNAGDEAF
jgi:hypothetical protein